MSASHQAYRHARLERLLDDPNLLRRCPTPTALNRCDDLNSIRRVGHRHGCMPHTCQVGDRVRSVRGLSHSSRTGRYRGRDAAQITMPTVSLWEHNGSIEAMTIQEW